MSSYQERLDHVRGKRQYIARAVNALVEASKADGAALKSITWESLFTIPSWCLLDFGKTQELQIACGSVYLRPLVSSSVDGAVLMQFKECVGDSLFDFLFEISEQDDSHDVPNVVLPPDDSLAETIKSVGASVLLGTLPDLNMVKIYMPLLGKPLLVLDAEQSAQAYKLACDALQLAGPASQFRADEPVYAELPEAASL